MTKTEETKPKAPPTGPAPLQGPTREEKDNAKKAGDGVPRSYAGDDEKEETSFGSAGGTGGGD